MTGAEFAAFAEGWTLRFSQDGRPFGAETYLPDREVIWRPEGGACARGVWGEVGGRICFFYHAESACWLVFRDAAGVIARSADGSGTEVRVEGRDRRPLACGDEPAV